MTLKKSNVILAIILAAASIFLLWLWFYLGFNMVDNPIDLTVSIVWWVVIVAVIALIVWSEKKRQQAVRTVFVGEGEVFNPETGAVEFEGAPVDEIETLLDALAYGFGKKDLPDDASEKYSAIVKSPVFKVKKTDSDNAEREVDWEGEVVFVATGESERFSSREELEKLLAA